MLTSTTSGFLGSVLLILEEVYRSCGDFMWGFLLGRFARELFLKLLGSVMNDIKHNFIDIVSTERILQRKVAV